MLKCMVMSIVYSTINAILYYTIRTLHTGWPLDKLCLVTMAAEYQWKLKTARIEPKSRPVYIHIYTAD